MSQPVFASAGGFPRLLYIPVPEFFDMHKAAPELEDATAVSISSAGSIDVSSSPERRQVRGDGSVPFAWRSQHWQAQRRGSCCCMASR